MQVLEDLFDMLPKWLYPWMSFINDSVDSALEFLDLNYLQWLVYLFTPVIIAFLLPIILVLFLYGSVLWIHIYRSRHRVYEAYSSSLYDAARATLASFWDAHGYIWHGYEVEGLEHIPESGPALIIYYHGTIPVDIYYLVSKCLLHRKRNIHCVGDQFLFKIPGWSLLLKVFCVTPGSVESCVEVLKAGHVLCIAPGGVREALFSHPYFYDLVWAERLGFARVALQAKVPVIPMFTENCREAFRTPIWGRSVFRFIYEKTRLPLMPVYGNFPVKLRSHLGAPLAVATEDDTVDARTARSVIEEAVEQLIARHQTLPGNIFRALLARFWRKQQTRNRRPSREKLRVK